LISFDKQRSGRLRDLFRLNAVPNAQFRVSKYALMPGQSHVSRHDDGCYRIAVNMHTKIYRLWDVFMPKRRNREFKDGAPTS
jgi:hypothetical protein